MAYRPVSTTDRLCQHSHAVFQANHKRRLYCSSSCNTLACQARKTTKSAKASPIAVLPKADERTLPLTAQNVATLTVGAGIVAGLN